LFPLEQPYVIANDSDVWQHEDDMITDLFQPPRDDLLQHSHDDFLSYPGRFDTYPFEHLDLFYEEDLQPPLCSNFDEDEAMICPEHKFHDESFQPSSFPSSCYTTEDTTGKHVPCPKLSWGKFFSLEFKGRLEALRRTLTSHFFNLPLSNYQSSSIFLFIPSQASGSDESQG
jgi:hypothetical protein